MDKSKQYKAQRRGFEKEIRKLMKKKVKEEKHKSEEASTIQKSEEVSEGVGTTAESQKLDFSYWEILMTTHLKAHNVWSFVDPGLQQGANEVARRKDQLALSQIHPGIDYSIFGKIANAKEAWDILKLSHKGVEKAQKSKLQ
ncbi:hypothetical protein KIW84_034040 [Lathyrus oleraceus]|uniref:Uncharacterized protein n=1 Tax=Pisum sativum TaxID=3888 RepID=A0A9D5B0Q2_PEA|nr:hypothetical protein KIW84_034040 [Pisum sativum]